MKITTFTKENKKHVMLSDGMYDSFLGFRIREKDVDLKVRTEIKVVGELWDCNTNSYKRTRKLSADEQKKFNTLIATIIDTITDEFDYTTATAEWVREVVANCINPRRKESYFPTFAERIEQYRHEHPMEISSSKAFIPTINKLNRFVAFKRDIEGNEEYELHVETIQADDFEDFRDYVGNEWHLREEYPEFYAQFDFGTRKPRELSRTGVINIMHHLRIVHHWCIRQGITTNKACDAFTIPDPTYGTPYYLTLEERNIIYDADFSDNPSLDLYRDMFIFQSLVGCRLSDLFKFTFENIHKCVLSFVPQKTKKKTRPAIGALKMPATAPAAPQPTNTINCFPLSRKRCPRLLPIALPVSTMGASAPTLPPKPIVRALATTEDHVLCRLMILCLRAIAKRIFVTPWLISSRTT